MSTETRKVLLTRLNINGAKALTSGKALQIDSKSYLAEYTKEFITLNHKAKENNDKIIVLHREVTDLYNSNNNDFTKSSIGVMYSVFELLRDENQNKLLMNYIEKHFLENSDKLNLENYKALVRSVKAIKEEKLINDNFPYVAHYGNLAKILVPKNDKLNKVIKGGLTLNSKQLSEIKGSIERVYNVNSELKSFTNELKRELQGLKIESLSKEILTEKVSEILPQIIESLFAKVESENKEGEKVTTEKVEKVTIPKTKKVA